MTSSTELDVTQDIKMCQRRTKPRPWATRTKIGWSLAVWFSSYASMTDKQIYSSQYFTSLPGEK